MAYLVGAISKDEYKQIEMSGYEITLINVLAPGVPDELWVQVWIDADVIDLLDQDEILKAGREIARRELDGVKFDGVSIEIGEKQIFVSVPMEEKYFGFSKRATEVGALDGVFWASGVSRFRFDLGQASSVVDLLDEFFERLEYTEIGGHTK